VTEPVRLHVAAKRILCATEADYFSRLVEGFRPQPVIAGRADVAAEVVAF